MITFRDLVNDLRELGLNGTQPVIAHASLSAFGKIQGGADSLVGALLAVSSGLMMPTFTYKTMVTPETGPPNNGITYGSGAESNRMAEFFHPEMPADPLMGVIAETLRNHPEARRSQHPTYSFAGVNVADALAAQSVADPFAPVRVLTDSQGMVLLLGVGHTANTSIHYAEKLAGRKQFIRWALTPKGVRQCPDWPGCSTGFNAIAPEIETFTRKLQIGNAIVQLIPLTMLVKTVKRIILQDPAALLCNRIDCERCLAIRTNIATP